MDWYPISMRTIRTAKKRARFLEALEATGSASDACRLAGISRTATYDWRDEDAQFKADWEKAIDRSTDLLEEEARRRAYKGVRKPVYQGGVLVGHIQEYSDTLLICLLNANKPDKYVRRMKVSGDKENPLAFRIDSDGLIERIVGNRKDEGEPSA